MCHSQLQSSYHNRPGETQNTQYVPKTKKKEPLKYIRAHLGAPGFYEKYNESQKSTVNARAHQDTSGTTTSWHANLKKKKKRKKILIRRLYSKQEQSTRTSVAQKFKDSIRIKLRSVHTGSSQEDEGISEPILGAQNHYNQQQTMGSNL